MDTELLSVVSSDLEFLAEEWDQEVSDHSLRRSSNVLRMLLVNGELLRAWRAAGLSGQPVISAPTVRRTLGLFPRKTITYAQAGGALYKGIETQSLVLLNIALGKRAVKKLQQLGPEAHRETLKLTDFVESPCMVVLDQTITRRKLIQYIANKLGGAHFDPRRDAAKEQDKAWMALDAVRQMIQLADKNAVYYELLAAGQFLIKSRSIAKLRQRIHVLLG